jgi:hypothetical protein
MGEPNTRSPEDIALEIGVRDRADLFVYNGDIERESDLDFIQCVHTNKRNDRCKLLLVTNGGDADAAYKISRYLQERYELFECLITGICKSGGTLIAIGAHELVFLPYGELGPLDVQIHKEDKLAGFHSGLNISEALQTLERRAIQTYLRLIGEIIKSSSGVVSFPTASKAASELVSGLYAPIFGKIDAEDVGGRTRSMRIAADYGKRLDLVAKNMQPGALQKLAETYSSHSFVIDKTEASALFRKVRDADALELELVSSLGSCARWPVPTRNNEPIIDCLTATDDECEGEITHASGSQAASEVGSQSGDGAHPSRAGEPSDTESGRVSSTNGGRSAATDF